VGYERTTEFAATLKTTFGDNKVRRFGKICFAMHKFDAILSIDNCI